MMAARSETDMHATSRWQPRSLVGLAWVVILCVIWLGAGFELQRSRSNILREADKTAVFQAHTYAEHTLATLKRLDGVLRDLREQWQDSPDTFATQVRYEMEYLNDVAFQISVVDAQGYLVYSSLEVATSRVYLGEREHFRVHRDQPGDRLFISPPVKGKVSGKWSIQFTRPILRQGQFAGVLVVSVSPDSFATFNEKLGLGDSAVTGMVADSGAMLARQPDNALAMGKKLVDVPYLQPNAPRAGSFRQVAAQSDGVARIYGFYRMPEYGLTFTVGYATADILVPYYHHRGQVLLAAVVASLIVSALVMLLRQTMAEQNRIAARLRSSEARLRAIVDTEPECVKVLNQRGELIEMNLAGLSMIGADSFEQVKGRPVVDLIAPAYREAYLQLHQQVIGGTRQIMEYELNNLKGGRYWVQTHAVPMEINGEVLHLAITRDISERKHAEETLRSQAAALARSNTELEQFAYVVSHDLRQPLRMVNSYMQMLMRRLADKLDDDTRQMMHFASEGATRMDQMLVALLEYSRVGRKGAPMGLLSSRDGLDEALRFLAPAIREAQAEVRVSGDWPDIIACRDEFTRLLQNLIGNALKYHAPDRPPVVEVSVVPLGTGWRFCVNDNGIGIDPEQFDRLFKVFQRLHTRDKYEGTGIGLAVARKIVERHGGQISVESAGENQGCRFCFTLPAQPPESTEPESSAL